MYELLDVRPTASPRQIADARRRLMRRWHPDVNASNEALAMSKAINRAADILLDPVQRKDYDTYRMRVMANQQAPAAGRQSARPRPNRHKAPRWTPPPIPDPPFWPPGIDPDVIRWVWWHTRLDLYYDEFGSRPLDPDDPVVRRAYKKRLHRTLDPKWRLWHVITNTSEQLAVWAFVVVAGWFGGTWLSLFFGVAVTSIFNVSGVVFAAGSLVAWGRWIVWPLLIPKVMDEIRLPRRTVL